MSRAPSDAAAPGASRGPILVLLVLAVLELVVNRVVLHALAPSTGESPATWYAALDYVGLFLSYFVGALAVGVIVLRAVATLRAGAAPREAIAHVALLGAAALFAIEIVLDAPDWVAIPAEALFAAATLAVTASAYGRGRDLGAQIGISLLALPLVLHSIDAFGVHFVWENVAAHPARTLGLVGVKALALAALVSPYCFAPRPFARAVARPMPIIAAMALAAIGAVAARQAYPRLVPLVQDAIGVPLAPDRPDGSLAVYLLAVATLAWTLVSCALARSSARREIGIGIALVVLGGNAFHWPVHFLLPLVGLSLVAGATRRVRDEELALTPIAQVTPPIADAAWAGYIGAVAAALERAFADVHTLTMRGEGGLVTTVIVADQAGLPVRLRIERFEGAVLAIDVVIGREIDEVRGATFTLWAMPARTYGINPSGPPAAPPAKTGDAELDARFKLRGSVTAFHALFDAPLRARAAAMLAGWLAYWERDGLRYRVYPGRGSPMDLPVPLSDLALGRPAKPDRLVAIAELLAEAGARGVVPPTAPVTLAHSGDALSGAALPDDIEAQDLAALEAPDREAGS